MDNLTVNGIPWATYWRKRKETARKSIRHLRHHERTGILSPAEVKMEVRFWQIDLQGSLEWKRKKQGER